MFNSAQKINAEYFMYSAEIDLTKINFCEKRTYPQIVGTSDHIEHVYINMYTFCFALISTLNTEATDLWCRFSGLVVNDSDFSICVFSSSSSSEPNSQEWMLFNCNILQVCNPMVTFLLFPEYPTNQVNLSQTRIRTDLNQSNPTFKLPFDESLFQAYICW